MPSNLSETRKVLDASKASKKMAKKFFPKDWETISHEELIRSRARLSGFVESIPDKDKAIRDVSTIVIYTKLFKKK